MAIYDCCWLTSWPYTDLGTGASASTLIRSLYGAAINQAFRYADWDRDHPDGKAGFVLRPESPEDWYWLEDPIPKGEQEALSRAGKLDRYIHVEPTGPCAFREAINELFRYTGKTGRRYPSGRRPPRVV